MFEDNITLGGGLAKCRNINTFFKRSTFCNLKFQVAFWRTFPVSRYGSTVFFQSALCSTVEWLFGRFLLVNIFGYF